MIKNKIPQMRERITIKQPVGKKQNNGEITETISTIATVWASVMPVKSRRSNRDRFEDNRKTPVAWYRILIRHRDDIDINTILEWNGKSLDIEFIDPYFTAGRRNFQLITCKYMQGVYKS